MEILCISKYYPMYDRQAGDLRLFKIIQILSAKHSIAFYCYDAKTQSELFGKQETENYKSKMTNAGVAVFETNLKVLLKRQQFDIILIEFYYAAQRYIDDLRYWQPEARVIVDSVDVHFQRLLSKASLTKSQQDYDEAIQVKLDEMAVYNKSDIVITVTGTDKNVLLGEDNGINIEVIPTIHEVLPLTAPSPHESALVFVGGFRHSPNIDAMLYFCRDIFPLIRRKIPGCTLTIVGSSPPPEILSLSSAEIVVTGYVPETKPYLESSYISVAPLRFGGGMKGKIGEAVSHGLPVVTTSFGIEGIGLSPGENILVGDDPDAFAEAVIGLIKDRDLYEKIRKNAWLFFKQNYSEKVIADLTQKIVERTLSRPIKRLSITEYLKRKITELLEAHLLWRFNKINQEIK